MDILHQWLHGDVFWMILGFSLVTIPMLGILLVYKKS